MKLQDRLAAGYLLAKELIGYANHSDFLVFGLANGGIPVAHEISKRLNLPLEIFLVRKLGVPGYAALGMGAISLDGVKILNESIIKNLNISDAVIEEKITAEKKELMRRHALYCNNRPIPNVTGKSIILVDDGVATGASMRVAISALREKHPAKIIVAIPVAAQDSLQKFHSLADEIVCLNSPESFGSIGQWYRDFSQITDEDVLMLLSGSSQGENKTIVEKKKQIA